MNDWGLKGNKTQARRGAGGGGRTSQLNPSRVHLYHPQEESRPALAGLGRGVGRGFIWPSPPARASLAQPSPSLSSANTGLGP